MTNVFKSFSHWDVIVWLTLLSAIGIFEGLGIANDKLMTLSALIRATVPAWVRAMILGWLIYHFMLQTGK